MTDRRGDAFLLAATALDLAAVPIGALDEVRLRRMLALPDRIDRDGMFGARPSHMTTCKLMIALALGAGAVTVGCGPANVHVTATTNPRLVWVEPGVWIVESSPYAVYYSDGYYWRYDGGIWYRSPYYNDGFVRVQLGIVPRIVVGAYRPVHVHYRAPSHVHARPIVRDHRAPRRR